MSEIRNRFDNSKKEEDTTKEVISEVVDLGDSVDKINEDLNNLVNEAVECNEGLKDMTRSMYLSDNEGSDDNDDASNSNSEENSSDDKDDCCEDEGKSEEKDVESEEEEEEESEEEEGDDDDSEDSDDSDESEESHKCQVQTRIIFVPVKQREDDGIPGLITGVATLLLCVWAMRALCIICAIGTECYPKNM